MKSGTQKLFLRIEDSFSLQYERSATKRGVQQDTKFYQEQYLKHY